MKVPFSKMKKMIKKIKAPFPKNKKIILKMMKKVNKKINLEKDEKSKAPFFPQKINQNLKDDKKKVKHPFLKMEETKLKKK